MTNRWLLAVLALALVPVGVGRADLKAALAERDLGRRSKLALDNASDAMKEARKAFEKGDSETMSRGRGSAGVGGTGV